MVVLRPRLVLQQAVQHPVVLQEHQVLPRLPDDLFETWEPVKVGDGASWFVPRASWQGPLGTPRHEEGFFLRAHLALEGEAQLLAYYDCGCKQPVLLAVQGEGGEVPPPQVSGVEGANVPGGAYIVYLEVLEGGAAEAGPWPLLCN